jgi:hypothetical protein
VVRVDNPRGEGLVIEVTQEYVDEARKRRRRKSYDAALDNPIAVAVSEECGVTVSVCDDEMQDVNGTARYRLQPDVLEALRRYEQTGKFEPATFDFGIMLEEDDED